MRMASDSKKSYFLPKSLNELDELALSQKEELTFVAGTTDLMVQEKAWQQANNLVDLTSLPELSKTLQVQDKGVLIGAALPISDLISNPIVREKFPILVDVCRQIGSVQIQNRATLGGNIANASPAGDSLPVLAVLDAEIWIGPRARGEFLKQKIDQIMIGPGQTSLAKNNYIAKIYIPFPKSENQFWYFRKVGQRKALAISKVSLAVLGWMKDKKIDEIRICTGSVTAQIKRAEKTENLLSNNLLTEEIIENARVSIINEVEPISDIRSTRDYRKHICGELLREALYNLLS